LQRFSAALPWLLGGVALATALALLAPLGWPFELFSHFRVQYAAASLLLAVLLAWRRAAAPTVLAMVLGVWHALPGFAASPRAVASQACAGPAFTVATVNLQFSNTRPEAFRAWIATQPADFLVIQEVTEAWAAELEEQVAYPHRHVLSRQDPYGLALLSRWPLESVTLVDLAGDGLPSLAGVLDAGGQRVRFLGLHTHWPLTPALAAARDEALRGAAALASAAELPVVLLGDLNLTPDSPAFARLLDEAGLRDAMDGRGWRPTWLAWFWPLALRIDHVLVSPDLSVEHAGVGPPIGSDHRPVVVRLRSCSQDLFGGQGLASGRRELAAALE
jgi:endonuclease/exonuclease/phosphatase (EEP) superfamily protein YafD